MTYTYTMKSNADKIREARIYGTIKEQSQIGYDAVDEKAIKWAENEIKKRYKDRKVENIYIDKNTLEAQEYEPKVKGLNMESKILTRKKKPQEDE